MSNQPSSFEKRPDFMSSPFRYPGNQVYALEVLLSLIPEHSVYVEPFCGGASTFFGKTKAMENWLNDIDEELITTYRAIRDQPEKLIAFLIKEKTSKDRHDYFKTEFRPNDAVETAARWFYLNRTSRLESMSRFWEYDDQMDFTSLDWNKMVLECSRKLQGVKLTFGDFEEVVDQAQEGAFLFIAPPYSIHHSSAQNRLYKHPFEREAHFRLANALRRKDRKVKFLVTYNENEELREIYSWGDDITVINLPNVPPQKEEIVIMNYRL